MKTNKLKIALTYGLLLTAVVMLQGCGANAEQQGSAASAPQQQRQESIAQTTVPPPAFDAHEGHQHGPQDATRVPAHQTAKDAKRLLSTLSPAQFSGKTRAAYQAVKEIPQTIAQLPCYCYCDEAFGHKSLHSCFVDTHASQCAVCVDEALLAYKLHKEQKLTPEQIRAQIIEQYSQQP
ncbi:MAG: CYCXC family (seleno)protein [Pyrinomonadaceae bacterium]|nr:hypothetical protein [Pyrinomonadaceae bacterium]MDQ3584841.1 PCYCGC domain-containing protein [Acidobacteriota bacterium]